MAHEHGAHKCYCPKCGAEIQADAYVKCNTIACSECGTRMRAVETGELRPKGVATMVSAVAESNAPCAVCSYPIREASYIGEMVKCPYCGSINEAISQVTIPTPVFVGFICFGAGVLFGPALLASTAAGQSWMQRQIRERIK